MRNFIGILVNLLIISLYIPTIHAWVGTGEDYTLSLVYIAPVLALLAIIFRKKLQGVQRWIENKAGKIGGKLLLIAILIVFFLILKQFTD